MNRTFEGNAENFLRYSSVMSNAHYDMAEKYRLRHHHLGIAVVTVSALASASALGSLAEGELHHWGTWIKICISILSVLATVLAALQTFLRFSDLQTQHKLGADGYSNVRREIDLLLMKYPSVVDVPGADATAAIEAIKKKLDDLDRASPTIPDDIYEVASMKTPSGGE